jgi:hypothetical protein
MEQQAKNNLIKALEMRERILKGQLQFYVKYQKEIPEGKEYANEQINEKLDQLREIQNMLKELK